MRFDERLSLHFDIEEGAEDALMPSLLLQPLVEELDQVRDRPRHQRRSISVGARVFGGELLLSVADDGPGPGPGQWHSVQGRRAGDRQLPGAAAGIYGDDQSMRLSKTEPHGLTINIRLPLERQPVGIRIGRP